MRILSLQKAVVPRYYIDTFDGFAALDEEGQEFDDRDALRREIHRALSAIMHDEADGGSTMHLRADARDESGERVMTATLLMTISEK